MDTDEIRYKRNYLTKVIFRLDYQPILILQNQQPAEFQDRIRGRLPELEHQTGFEVNSQISPQGKKDETIALSNWLFRDSLRRYVLTLNHRFLAIEDTKYTNLEDLISIVTLVTNAFEEAYSEIVYTRIGLRYINEVRIREGSPLDWEGYIASHLTESFKGMKPPSQLARAMSQTVFNRNDHLVVFNHGIFNSEFPSPISRKEFILDYDASSTDVNSRSIVDSVRSFNQELVQMFESCIGDKLRQEMESI